MAYLVFARKWRPLSFEDVVGQSHITETLKRAIEKDRVAHAYIFTGTRGVGKTTTARIMARALNCDNGPTTEPCGTCQSCLSVINGNSFDVMEIDGASNNGVDQIRELRDNIGYTSMGGKYRIFVIDEVHMLTTGAFNALLKTLEEPPEKVIFIFATTEPQKIPNTIHSRCQRFDFRAISEEAISGHIATICKKENITFDNESLSLIAHKANGSMRDSLSLLDQVCSFCGENLKADDVRSVLGLISSETYSEILRFAMSKNSGEVIKLFEKVLQSGYDISEFITGFLEFMRELIVKQIQNDNSTEQFADIYNYFSRGDMLRISELIKKCEDEIRFTALPRFSVELMLIKIIEMDRTLTLQAILDATKGNGENLTFQLTQNIVQQPKQIEPPKVETTIQNEVELPKYNPKTEVETEEKEPKPPTAIEVPNMEPPKVELIIPVEEPVIEEDNGDTLPMSEEKLEPPKESIDILNNWTKFIDKFKEEHMVLGQWLILGKLINADSERVDIQFKELHSFQKLELAKKDNRELIEKELADFTGVSRRLHLTTMAKKEEPKKETNTKEPVFTPQISDKEIALKDDIEAEPILQEIIGKFNAELI